MRIGGHVAVIGVLAGAGDFDPRSILMKAVRMQGILVGSRRMFEEMNKAIEGNRLKPVIDKTFAFGTIQTCLRSYFAAGTQSLVKSQQRSCIHGWAS